MVRRTLRRILERAGHEVACATDGREGLELFEQLQPEIVVTDMIMPEQDGITTIQAIRASGATPRIVAVSGGARTEDVNHLQRARDVGADAVLETPFAPRQRPDPDRQSGVSGKGV